jgi:hypothetical protein
VEAAPAAAGGSIEIAPVETIVAGAEPATSEIASAETVESTVTVKAVDPALLARQLQTELARVGCYAGTIDGDWGRRSAAALDRFSEAAGIEIAAGEPSGEALDAVTSKQETVCEAKVCAAGLEPDADGDCVAASGAVRKKATHTEPESKPVKRAKAKSEPKATKTKPVKKATTRKTKSVSTEQPKRKSMMTKSGKFDCAIYGTNTALQDLHRRQGHCE